MTAKGSNGLVQEAQIEAWFFKKKLQNLDRLYRASHQSLETDED
jgi:hypothetical protein